MTTSNTDGAATGLRSGLQYYTQEELTDAFGSAPWRGPDRTEPTGTVLVPSKRGVRIMLALAFTLAISLPALAYLDGGAVSVSLLSIAALWFIFCASLDVPEGVWMGAICAFVVVIAPTALFRDGTWGDKLIYASIGAFILLALSLVTPIRAGMISDRELSWDAIKDLRKLNVDLTDSEIYGFPGDLQSGIGKFSGANIAKGSEGELRTAELLEELLTIPGTRIVHGLAWPGTDHADIDHVVVNGARIAVIDSKMWGGGSYVTNGHGGLFRLKGDDVALDMNVHTDDAVRDLRAYLLGSGVTVAGWLAIHSSDGQPVDCDIQLTPDLRAVPAFEAINQIGAWLAEGSEGTIDPLVMWNVFRLLK